ncbi:MAG: FdrA family protein, partial [Actinomycetota bacterium]|nr:FdrA family protein [Actinomycetota bacterium]
MTTTVEVRSGVYHDSVTLLQVSRTVTGGDGVEAAIVAMATELNVELARDMGFDVPAAGPNDLLVAVRAVDDEAASAALAVVTAQLAAGARGRGAGTGPDDQPALTTSSALRRTGAPLVLVSVPGPSAFPEAMDALEAGSHVLVFSDNVPVSQEVRLKDEGARRGLLVMGPDCGTAVVGGVGLGFANVVRPGPVGLVAASGTGAQQLLCLLDAAGVGVSHCLGVGGRDLSADVGARATRQALRMLDEDPATELIVLVSKPPAKAVEDEVRAFAATLATPVQLALLGRGRPDLTAAARIAVRAIGGTWEQPRFWPAPEVGAGASDGTGGSAGGAAGTT